MCIAIICTSHPDYPFILINNRDEYLTRPTAKAAFWDEPNSHVLGGRDLLRDVRGTWLGITKQGRIAVLTNYREQDDNQACGLKSRGAMVNSFLTTPPDSDETTDEFARRLVEEVGVTDVGGFTLVCGKIRSFVDDGDDDDEDDDEKDEMNNHHNTTNTNGTVNGTSRKHTKRANQGLAVISNRSANVSDLTWIANRPDSIHGLSNSRFGDYTWPKVVHGELLMRQSVDNNAKKCRGDKKQDLIARLFELLSLDTLPRRKRGEEWEVYLGQLRNSIFIPRIGGEQVGDGVLPAGDDAPAGSASDAGNAGNAGDGTKTARIAAVTSGEGLYATQKQTVILVDKGGRVTFVEKTLYDENGEALEEACKQEFEFDIEGWGS